MREQQGLQLCSLEGPIALSQIVERSLGLYTSMLLDGGCPHPSHIPSPHSPTGRDHDIGKAADFNGVQVLEIAVGL